MLEKPTIPGQGTRVGAGGLDVFLWLQALLVLSRNLFWKETEMSTMFEKGSVVSHPKESL